MSGSQNMIRVRNVHTARVAKIERGAEGVLPDSAALRAMVAGGLLKVLEGDISGPAPVPQAPEGAKAADALETFGGLFVRESDVRKMAADFDRSAAALREELDKVSAKLVQSQADRNDLAAKLEAAEKALAAAVEGAAAKVDASASAPAEKPAKGSKG